jgi:hypothetical protein
MSENLSRDNGSVRIVETAIPHSWKKETGFSCQPIPILMPGFYLPLPWFHFIRPTSARTTAAETARRHMEIRNELI